MTDLERIRALTDAQLDVELALWELNRRKERLTELLDTTTETRDTGSPAGLASHHNLTRRPD